MALWLRAGLTDLVAHSAPVRGDIHVSHPGRASPGGAHQRLFPQPGRASGARTISS